MTATLNPALQFLQEQGIQTTSPVNVCFSSRSSAGAWQIRGEQIAMMRANWEAINSPVDDDLERFDLFCFIKKPDFKLIRKLKKLKKPYVFDIVDSWAQPADGLKYTDQSGARELFAESWKEVDADGYIFPTRHMQSALSSLVRTHITIYHHFRPQIQPNPIRERVSTVGYEGADYLGPWREIIRQICDSRKISFVENPANYTDMDIVVLARGGEHSSFLANSYKSNVKLANAYGSGTPALVHFKEMSAHDVDCGDIRFFSDHPDSFERQLDALCSDHELRKRIHQNFLKSAEPFKIQSIATQFEAFFLHVLKQVRQLGPI